MAQVVASGGGPQVSSNKSEYEQGDPISINFSGGPGNPTDRIELFSFDDQTNQRVGAAVDWVYLNGTQVVGSAKTDGNVTFVPANSPTRGTDVLAPGGYDVVFVSDDDPELAMAGIGIKGTDQGPGPDPGRGPDPVMDMDAHKWIMGLLKSKFILVITTSEISRPHGLWWTG